LSIGFVAIPLLESGASDSFARFVLPAFPLTVPAANRLARKSKVLRWSVLLAMFTVMAGYGVYTDVLMRYAP
jgi:hypothetical protein